MFGLDQVISGLGKGGDPAIVLAVALLLGLRQATDPDHLVAVSTLVANEDARRARRAAGLGLAWGLGHASSLLALGLPFVLVAALAPPTVEVVAEALIGVVIMLLAARLLLRWREGAFHAHIHRHGPTTHRHLHAHGERHHDHAHEVRSPLTAYGIGVVHGIGGSAGIALLLLAGIHDHGEALAALVLFALATAASMAMLSAVFGLALGVDRVRARFLQWSPAFAALAFAFGFGYSAAALGAVL